ncbi:MAPEG family protein [Pukyongiella litopenaei]|uniref:MAPEG family protein n=1 Tax=Pukyongiella litopenaei TaxID=2605946 RepID=A0A2S0MMU4_9RHOB|nr:MAPEG family protein [Pukyongiella litopenaei]AVO37208.1 MAPEG family protein [Pukyongiella litopenaei]
MDTFAAYSHAIASVALFALIVLALSPLSALRKGAQGLAPGAEPVADYADPAYRLHRAFQNGSDTLGIFVAVTAAAILAGASPVWVNWLASLVLVSRIVMLVVHLRGIGQPHSGPRSFAYVAGWLCMVLLALSAVVAAF